MSNLSAPHFHDEKAAYEFVEARIWPEGPICPHCGGMDRISPMKGKSTRIGTYKCYDCRKPFTVKIGTIFEASNVKMTVWLQAIYLMAASKKGISTHQLHRTLGVALRTAWFMSHRIREAMREGDLAPFGINGGAVEVDETFIGNDRTRKPHGEKKGRGYHHKHKILALVDRNSRRARTMVIDSLAGNLRSMASCVTAKANTVVATSEPIPSKVSLPCSSAARKAFTNTAEKKHLHRYAAEFEFRYNHRIANGFNDLARADQILNGFKGKRLMYRDSLAALAG